MKQLELRRYSRQEIEAITGHNKGGNNFRANVRNTLTKWGYQYDWPMRGEPTITRKPETPEERLSELMIRLMGLDVQIQVKPFAYFLYLLLRMDGFDSMPWDEREALMREFGIDISAKTLRNWIARLIDGGHVLRDKYDREYWRTRLDGDRKVREPIDPKTDNGYQQYKTRRTQILADNFAAGMNKREAWNEMYKELWAETQCCYYGCPRFTLNALGENSDDVFDCVDAICGE